MLFFVFFLLFFFDDFIAMCELYNFAIQFLQLFVHRVHRDENAYVATGNDSCVYLFFRTDWRSTVYLIDDIFIGSFLSINYVQILLSRAYIRRWQYRFFSRIKRDTCIPQGWSICPVIWTQWTYKLEITWILSHARMHTYTSEYSFINIFEETKAKYNL